MLKLATILDNPGEPLAESRYRDPRVLREMGFNGVILFETVGLSGLDGPDSVADTELRRWVSHQFERVEQRVRAAKEAGLDAYVVFDTLTLARDVVERQVAALTCKGRPTTLCPGSDAAIEKSVASLESMLNRLPDAAGVVLRFGDNDASRLPYLVGNDIHIPHCSRCSPLGRADRIVRVLDRFYEAVVNKLNRRLIARAWNVRPDGMHDSAELCQRLAKRLPGNPDDPNDHRFVLSFKFTQTDFWRYQSWNPSSLVFGNRPIIYELECQREFEGKGGIPNWQAPLWRDGPPEMQDPRENPMIDKPMAGLARVSEVANVAGLWAWVRGGGWGGPFVTNETWIDANVFAVPKLADDPQLDLDQLADDWIANRLEITEPALTQAIKSLLEDSPNIVLYGFYIGPYAKALGKPWHPNSDWIQDDMIDAQSAWRIVQHLGDAGLDEAVREKQLAVDAIARHRARIQMLIDDRRHKHIEPLMHMLVYAESLLETLRDLVTGLVAYRKYQRSKDTGLAKLTRERLLMSQSHWQHHTQRHGSLPGAATAFRENQFWELTQRILSEVS
ncbi:MAG: hypothetical protein GC164_11295 [Phycisphaera sp.]|nr:hypothetical protein [Phycisphaera sp.]